MAGAERQYAAGLPRRPAQDRVDIPSHRRPPNSGGEKIHAEEVEKAIRTHPDVRDVVVVGRPSDLWGQEVVALVELALGADATDDEMRDHVRASIAKYKVPKAILRVPAVKRQPTGKVDYRWASELASSTSRPSEREQPERGE